MARESFSFGRLMRRFARPASVLAAFGAAVAAGPLGCAAPLDDIGSNSDDLAQLGKLDLKEGTPEAHGVLEVASVASFDTLHASNEVGLEKTSADHIVAYRETDADHKYDTLAELGAVPNVGTAAFKKLLAYAKAHGYVDGGGTLACGAAKLFGPVVTPVNFNYYGTYDPGPLVLLGDDAHVFLEGSSMWLTASHGTAVTKALPTAFASGASFEARQSLSGKAAIVFQKGTSTFASSASASSFAAPVVTPCTSTCEARAAGDGHLWVRTNTSLFEQVGGAFQERGGPPVEPSFWDVDAKGAVLVMGTDDTQTVELLAIWKLAPKASGWTKIGKLLAQDVQAAAAGIEGGFRFGSNGLGTFAPDGSIHLFSDARCVGTGERNKKQLYLRSKNGSTWDIETLPDVGTLTDSQVTWRNVAFFAASYDSVEYVVMSSSKPAYDGWNWTYPSRRLNLIQRCRAQDGSVTFARSAAVKHPGWTARGFVGFSDTGVAAFLTSQGISQAY